MNDFRHFAERKLFVSLCSPKNLSFTHICVKIFFDFFVKKNLLEMKRSSQLRKLYEALLQSPQYIVVMTTTVKEKVDLLYK